MNPHLFLPLLLLITPALAAPLATTQPPTTIPATLEDLKTAERLQLEKDLAGLPAIGVRRLDDIIQIGRAANVVTVTSPLDATDGKSAVQIKDWPGYTTVLVQKANPQMFQLIHFDLADPDQIIVSTQVYSTAAYLQVARDFEGPAETRSASFIQTLKNPNGGEPGVKLFVKGTDEETGRSTIDLKLTAADLEQLIREHPKEAVEYLKPMFADLHQAAIVFSVDPKIAWQVFASEATIDDATREKVRKLAAQLDADSPEARESAAEQLHKLGGPAALILLQLDRSKMAAEPAARIDTLTAPYATLTKEQAAARRDDPEFLIDCLNSDEPQLRSLALTHLQKKLDKPIDFDLQSTPTDRMKQVSVLREKFLPKPATVAQ